MDRNEQKLNMLWQELFQAKAGLLEAQVQVQELTQMNEELRARVNELEAPDVSEEKSDEE